MNNKNLDESVLSFAKKVYDASKRAKKITGSTIKAVKSPKKTVANLPNEFRKLSDRNKNIIKRTAVGGAIGVGGVPTAAIAAKYGASKRKSEKDRKEFYDKYLKDYPTEHGPKQIHKNCNKLFHTAYERMECEKRALKMLKIGIDRDKHQKEEREKNKIQNREKMKQELNRIFNRKKDVGKLV